MAETLTLIGPALTHGVLVITRSVDYTSPNAARPDHLLPAYQRLSGFSELPKDWDSYGASPVSARAISGARRLLSRLVREFPDATDISPYALAPLANGGVQVEWRGAAGALEIEVGPNGRLSGLLIEDGERGRSYQERDHVSVSEATTLVSRMLGL